jgi:hypothetical protein
MNSFFNDYLVKCDLIYKYNLENINQTPKIEKVTVSLKINENFKELEIGHNLSFNLISIQLFLIVYIFYFSYPFIKYSKSKTSKENFFFLNSMISEKNLIYSFLDSFFVDNTAKIGSLNFLSLNYFKNNTCVLQKKKIFTIKVPLNFFDEITEFSAFHNLNIKELFVFLSFSIKNPIFFKLKNNRLFLKNLPYFWHLS